MSKGICSVEGCGRDAGVYGHCKKHRKQVLRHGTIVKSMRDRNDIQVFDCYAEIVLRNRSREECGRVKIDMDDLEKLKDMKWCLASTGYAICQKKLYPEPYMHRILCPGGMVDHINRDKLDNRKANLRLATRSQNNANKDKAASNTTGFKGVTKMGNSYIAQAKVNGKHIHLGCFKKPEDAARAYNNAALVFWGNFAAINIM